MLPVNPENCICVNAFRKFIRLFNHGTLNKVLRLCSQTLQKWRLATNYPDSVFIIVNAYTTIYMVHTHTRTHKQTYIHTYTLRESIMYTNLYRIRSNSFINIKFSIRRMKTKEFRLKQKHITYCHKRYEYKKRTSPFDEETKKKKEEEDWMNERRNNFGKGKTELKESWTLSLYFLPTKTCTDDNSWT